MKQCFYGFLKENKKIKNFRKKNNFESLNNDITIS